MKRKKPSDVEKIPKNFIKILTMEAISVWDNKGHTLRLGNDEERRFITVKGPSHSADYIFYDDDGNYEIACDPLYEERKLKTGKEAIRL